MRIWTRKNGDMDVPISDLRSIAPARFSSEKEASAPKAEGLSRLTRATIGFAAGFAAGYAATYMSWDVNSGGNFELVLMPTACVFGAINAARKMFIDKEQNSKDLNAFAKGCVPVAALTAAVCNPHMTMVVAGLTAGLVSLVYARMKSRKESHRE
ncbi:Uncharacterised protein [uncultured archaeon]|nr:Uncharacterised protein [uncultured archaeon]